LIIGSSADEQLTECKWFKPACIKKMIHAEIGYTTARKRDNFEKVVVLKDIKHPEKKISLCMRACLDF